MLDIQAQTKGTIVRPVSFDDHQELRVISPTIVANLKTNDPLVEAGEIFGPICPVIPVDTIDDVVRVAKKQ